VKTFSTLIIVVASIFLTVSAWAENKYAAAVVIGNMSYQGGRIPNVDFAHNDAEAFKRYLIDILGYREGNIIDLRDATQAQMMAAFGNRETHEGTLWQYLRPGRSDVTVFYSGHGVPGLKDRRGYLLPVDANPEKPEINGYPVDVLYKNLTKLGARSVTVFLDACFSGESGGGMLLSNTSGISIKPKMPDEAKGMVVLTAAQGDQVASWDTKAEHGLFTEHLLAAMYGGADQDPYGNGDGNVTVDEVKNYLDDEMTYSARRAYGRKQNASVQGAGKRIVSVLPAGRPLSRPAIQKTSLQPVPAKKPAVAVASPGKMEGDWKGGANFDCQDAPSWFDLAMNIKGNKITGSGSYGINISGKVEGETDITGSIFSGLGTARFKGSLSSGKLTGNFTDSEGCRGDFELGRD